jgi:hypothetical protein
MSVFPTAGHLASWAGQCPGNDQSAGKRRSGRTRKGSKWLDWALEESAMVAARSNDIYLAARYARLRPRRGRKKALGAVKHSILIACWPYPNAPPNDSSPNSRASATKSPSRTCHRPPKEPRPNTQADLPVSPRPRSRGRRHQGRAPPPPPMTDENPWCRRAEAGEARVRAHGPSVDYTWRFHWPASRASVGHP